MTKGTRVGSLVVLLGTLAMGCNSAPKGGGFGGDGEGGDSGDTGGGTGTTGGKSGGTGGKASGGSTGTGGDDSTGGSTGTGGAEPTGGNTGTGGKSTGGNTGTGGKNTGGAGGSSAGGAGGLNSAGCPTPPYADDPKVPASQTCGNTCVRCSGGDPTIEKILALTPPDGKMKVSQDYKLDSEADDPDSKPVIKAAIYKLNGAIYWVSDMDVDCDGRVTPGKCDDMHDGSFQPQTAFLGNASAAEVPYIVLPNNFPLGTYGIKGGQVAAIIYQGKIGYAVLGDTGPATIIGEASYAAAEMMGIPPSAINGGVNGRSVTFIQFTGPGAVPANITSRAEAKALGEKLLMKFLQDNTP